MWSPCCRLRDSPDRPTGRDWREKMERGETNMKQIWVPSFVHPSSSPVPPSLPESRLSCLRRRLSPSMVDGLSPWLGVRFTFHSLFISLFIHFFIHSFIHSFIQSMIYSFIYSFNDSFIHSFLYSSIHSFNDLFIHLFVHSFVCFHPLTWSRWLWWSVTTTRPSGSTATPQGSQVSSVVLDCWSHDVNLNIIGPILSQSIPEVTWRSKGLPWMGLPRMWTVIWWSPLESGVKEAV